MREPRRCSPERHVLQDFRVYRGTLNVRHDMGRMREEPREYAAYGNDRSTNTVRQKRRDQPQLVGARLFVFQRFCKSARKGMSAMFHARGKGSPPAHSGISEAHGASSRSRHQE